MIVDIIKKKKKKKKKKKVRIIKYQDLNVQL